MRRGARRHIPSEGYRKVHHKPRHEEHHHAHEAHHHHHRHHHLNESETAGIALGVVLLLVILTVLIYVFTLPPAAAPPPPPSDPVYCPPENYKPVTNGASIEYFPGRTHRITIPNTDNFLNSIDGGFTVVTWFKVTGAFFVDSRPLTVPFFQRQLPEALSYLYYVQLDMQRATPNPRGNVQARSTLAQYNCGVAFVGRSRFEFNPFEWNMFTYAVTIREKNGPISNVETYVNNAAYTPEAVYTPAGPGYAEYNNSTDLPLQISGTVAPVFNVKSLYFFNRVITPDEVKTLYLQNGAFDYARTLPSFKAGFKLGSQDEQWGTESGVLLGQRPPACYSGGFFGARIVDDANVPVAESQSDGTGAPVPP